MTVLVLPLQVACGGHSVRTARMRTALDDGRPADAVAALDEELGVKDGALPKPLRFDDDALLVLDRATIHQALGDWQRSKRDYEAADRVLDIMDLSHGAPDDVARAVLSDSAGRYVAPPHEKVLLNVLNMMNYLETRDLSGARVEARRMLVMSRFLQDFDRTQDRSLGFGSLLAGFVFEKSGEAEEAARFYADAERLDASLDEVRLFGPDDPEGDDAEILVVVGDGRVPHRVSRRVPIGLALTRAAPLLAAQDRDEATKLAAQGLVTWVNFPELAAPREIGPMPSVVVGGKTVALESTLDVTDVVRAHWRRIEGGVMAAALTRTVARVVAGMAVGAIAEAAANASSTSKKHRSAAAAVGLLASLLAQAALSAADVPDTRSWETLPARISVARLRVPPGAHEVLVSARGTQRVGRVIVEPHGWAALSVLALR